MASRQTEIRLTHLETYGPFIKLFAQANKDQSSFFEKLLHSLKSYFFDNKDLDLKPTVAKDIEVGLICVAKFEDGVYYRAKIVNIDNIRQYIVTVNFIDHGNTHEAKVTDIRLFSKLIKLLRSDSDMEKVIQLRDAPPLAEDYYLTSIAPKNKEWDENIVEHLKMQLVNNDLKCACYILEGKKCIKFLQPEFEPVNLLRGSEKIISVPLANQERVLKEINTKLAMKVSKAIHNVGLNLPPPAVLMQQPPPPRFPNLNQPPPGHQRASEMNFQSHSQMGLHQTRPLGGLSRPPGLVRSALPLSVRNPEFITNVSHSTMQSAPLSTSSVPSQYATETLAPGVSHSVFVSHIENGPHSFAIQLQDEISQLTKMMADLNSIEPLPITAPLNPGSVCLGRFSSDGCLCRTIVLGISGDQIKLNFVDYGQNETVHYTDVFQIPPQFLSYKTMSHRFALANISTVTYSDLEKKAFARLTREDKKPLVMKVMPMENPVRQYCEIYVEGKNVKQLIRDIVPTPAVALKFSPVSTPILGSQEKVFVSYVLNPGRFFVQLDKNHYQLNHTMQALKRHCQSAPLLPRQSLKVNEPCCAMYEDNTWYRAEILSLGADKAMINFVDYGNQEEIEYSNLRVISPELVNSLKAQAIRCCLKGYENSLQFDDEVANRLEELILEKKLMMHVESSVDQDQVLLIVTLLDVQGEDIASQLEPNNRRPIVSTSHINHMSAHVNHAPAPTDGWEDTATSNSREDRFSEGRGQRLSRGKRSPQGQDWQPNNQRDWQQQQPSNNKFYREDYKKSWRSREDKDSSTGGGRWNDNAKPREDKPWEKRDERFNRDDRNRGNRYNRDEESGGRHNRDEDSGGKFNRDGGSSRFNDSNRFGDKSSEERPSRFGGGKYDGGFNSEDKPFRKRDDDFGGGGYRGNRDRGDSSWRDKESSGGWKDNTSNHSGEGRQNDGFKRGGFNRDAPSGDRSSFKKPWERGTGDNQYQRSAPRSKSPKPDTVGGMPQSIVKVGVSEDAQVVFTTSPSEFYVQLQSSYDQLTQLMERIATACESGEVQDLSNAQEKVGCLAKYSEDDTWYRAVVEEKTFDSVKVLFVDYGNQESVTFDKIKELPEDMTSLPVQAIKCRLFGVPEVAETEVFSNLVDGKNLRTQFVTKDFTSKCFQVVLVDEETCTNINTLMGANEEEIASAISKMGLTTLSTLQYANGTQLSTQMTWFVNPSQFNIQVLSTHAEFRAMMQTMQTVVRTGSVLQNNALNVGDYVIARFKTDKVLYRACVKDTGYVPTVTFVDYGNVESVDSGSVWQMETQYATLPIQALSCCLAGVQSKGDAWPQGSDQYFEAEMLECTIVKEVEGETQYIVKLEKNGEDLAQKLIEAGLAEPGTDALGVPTELDPSLLSEQRLQVTFLRIEENFTFFVKPLPEDVELHSLEAVPGEGIKCTLNEVKEDATEEEINQFKQLPPDTPVIIIVDAVLDDGLKVSLFDKEGKLLRLQKWDVLVQSLICPLPVFNSHMKVFISHADKDGIYLQKSSYSDHLAELLQRLFEHYEQVEPVSQTWAVEDFCAAKSVADDQWYRAFIMEFSEEGTKVCYVDYGNSEVVPSSNLRPLDPAFYAPHALSLKVAFHVTWNVGLENLLELTGDTEYNAVLVSGTDTWVAELMDNSGQSLTEKLVELGFVTELENSPFKRVVEGGRFVEGSNIPMSVSFVDSPLQLWIFVGNDVEHVEALQDRLQEAAPKLPTLKEPNGVFAAKFSDGLWYRAIKLENSTVRFIDYGNSDTVDMSDIKSLSADFVERAEGYAVKVELPVMNFKEEATERLNELVITQEIDSEEEIVAHILSVRECSIVADIIKGGKSIVDILVEENLATRVQKITSGFVSQFNTLDNFFIQEVGCEDSLESMSNIMLNTDNFEPLVLSTDAVNEEDLVAALYTDDGLWYRAKVTKKSENEAGVVFIDYGNSAIATEFKKLSDDLAVQPALSKHCALQLPSGVNEWSEAASHRFLEISADGCTQFDIKFLNEDSPATVTLYLNGKSVNDDLKSLCVVNDTQETNTDSANVPIDLTGYDKIIYISHANSLDDFYIQVEGAETELDVIRERFADISSFEKIETITADDVGKIVGAFSADHEEWYRAKVLNITDNGSEVLLVDYGNTAVSTEFLKLPEYLENMPLVALHCSLDIVKEELKEEASANEHFVTLSGEGVVPFAMKIVKEGDPAIVSLLFEEKLVEKEISNIFGIPVEGKAVTEGVSSSGLESENQETIDDLELIKSVFLLQVNSPSDFYLHTSEGTQLLGEISEKLLLAEDYTSIEENLMSVGNIVAAQFDEDDLWYRAKILDHSGDETKVLFIDYGNTANVAKIKNLPEELVTIPPLAMHCSLQIAESTEWSESAHVVFNKMANEENISFDLKIVSEGDPNLVMLYTNGKSVSQQLFSANPLVEESSGKAKSTISLTADSEDEKENEIVSSSTEDTVDFNKNHQEQKGELEKAIKSLVLNSVETEINKRMNEDVHDITNDLITMAIESSKLISDSQTDKTAEEDTQETDTTFNKSDLAAPKPDEVRQETITDLKSSEGDVKEGTMESKSTKDEQETDPDSIINNQIEQDVQKTIDETISQVEINVPSSQISENHNGTLEEHEETSNVTYSQNESNEVKVTKKVDESSEDSFASVESPRSKDNANSSPPTPRRSNIDDHIVPGCISSVKLDDFTDNP